MDEEKKDALSFVLNAGFPVDLLSRIAENRSFSVTEAAQAIRTMLESGRSLDSILQEYGELYPDIVTDYSGYQRSNPGYYLAKPASEFGEDNTKFVWFPYIPIGDYSVLMAPGGTGKTYFCCGIAAAISTGKNLPGDYVQNREPQNVLIISAEDRGELLKKRLKASGADLERVFILDCMASEGLNFTDGYETFKAVIKENNPAIVFIDPWHGFLGADIDINRVNAVRPCFQKLANIAKDCGCGMVLVSHVNKRSQGENINFAATGSTDFVNAARSGLYLIFDEQDPDGRIVVHSKTNYASYGQSVKFHISEDGGVEWTGFSEIDRSTMEQAARQRKTPGEVAKQRDLLEEVNESLVEALLDAGIPFETVRFSYERFKQKYGNNIFGTLQPKKALALVSDILYGRGYEVKAGIPVKEGNSTAKGFAIFSISER